MAWQTTPVPITVAHGDGLGLKLEKRPALACDKAKGAPADPAGDPRGAGEEDAGGRRRVHALGPAGPRSAGRYPAHGRDRPLARPLHGRPDRRSRRCGCADEPSGRRGHRRHQDRASIRIRRPAGLFARPGAAGLEP